MTTAMTAETKASEKKPFIGSWVILAVYSALTLLGALNHELWLDEAQAWVILRDVPLAELPRVLNIEGHPPLWYAILYPFVKLGFPADYVSLISWFIMALGAAVLMFKVKLPLPLKAVILASSGFLYLNSVMLRVYCLIPPLLFLILWVYPNRREHAVLYGLLIALLVNTHVFICGIVGILGIYMIYELFSEWKSSPKKENIGKLIGLAIAGVGVLTLVLPLLGTQNLNSGTNNRLSDFSVIFGHLLNFPKDVFENYFNLCVPYSPLWVFPFMLMTVAVVIMLIMLRHWRKAFFVELGFVAVYIIICGIMWFSMPSRSAIFILSFAFSLGLAQYEEPVFKDHKISDRITGTLRRFVGLLKKADMGAQKLFTVVLAGCLGVSVPVGAILLYKDIVGNFSASKQTAEYISENLEEDAVFVSVMYGFPEISFYCPDYKQYSVISRQFTTYNRWNCTSYEEDHEEVIAELSEYDHLYIIYYYTGVEESETFFICTDAVKYDLPKTYFAICKYDPKIVEEYIKQFNAERGAIDSDL